MAERIFSEFMSPIGTPVRIERVTLIPGGGGVFDVVADGELAFSKHQVGRHANPDEVIAELRKRLP